MAAGYRSRDFVESEVESLKAVPRNEIEEIHDILTDAQNLAKKISSVVVSVIGYPRANEATGSKDCEPCSDGIIPALAEHSRVALSDILSAKSEVERLAKAFGV